MIRGAQSIAFECPAYLVSSASVAGTKEGEGPLGRMFDLVAKEDLFGENTWEEAESAMQKEACQLALRKAHLKPEEIRYLYGGDLLRQGVATSRGVEELKIPMFGLYGACSTSGEALALAGMSVAAGYGDYMLAVTSSHFASAEKEFRFPLGYASQRPLSAHWTVTGSGAFVVGKRKRIPFSTWLCESETTFFYLDSDRKRSLSGRKKEKPGADQWSDDWENCGLRIKGFAKHGSLYGSGGVRYHSSEPEGF